MRFQVPQFIETETKLIGPFTLKQFLYLGSGAGLLFFLYTFVKGILFIAIAVPIIAASIALAFVKINGIPLINYIGHMLSYLVSPKKYVYKKEDQSKLTLPGQNQQT